MNSNLKKYLRSALRWCIFTIVVTGVAVISRVLVFGLFTIPTSSMEPAIMAGDRVVVNKLIPGPLINKSLFSVKNAKKMDYTRLDGYRNVKRNDVLVFNYPYAEGNNLVLNMAVYYAKRCVAIPGDTFYIKNGIYKVDGVLDNLGNYESQRMLSERKGSDLHSSIFNCFPYDQDYNWNMKDFGPLYLPKENDTLAIDTLNVVLYKKLIEYETKEQISILKSDVYIGNSRINQYIFKKNYYFMAGDFIFNSNDSRYWGLLPEDHIIGKVSFVYKSIDQYLGENRWDRFLKAIN